MPPSQTDAAFLWDMREATHEIAELVIHLSLDEFREAKITRLAVERLVIILGEAASCVSEEYRLQHSEIPWGKIQRLRNTMAHTYGKGTATELYGTGREFLVPLSIQLGTLVSAPPQDQKDRSL